MIKFPLSLKENRFKKKKKSRQLKGVYWIKISKDFKRVFYD